MISRWATWVVVGVLLGSCGSREEVVTWSGGVAGIIHRHCSTCHRPGQPAPFSLLTFDDAWRKRRQIARVTASGYMPPWLPSHGDFIGARGLSQAEVDRVSAWVEGGAPRGDSDDEPSPPTFPSGWQLGEPDLVVTAEEWLELPAAGPDLFQNLVLPVEIGALRFVDAVEIRPGNPSVHHAVLQVDGTRGARALDAAEPGPGFGGMEMGLSVPPDGHFLGWTPGKATRRNGQGRSWRLWPGSDLVLQLHLTPTGKPERVRPSIGLYFTDVPPEETPFALVMRSERIDIAAGQTDFKAADHVVLPVATELRAVYPHAHYLCTQMEAWATPPEGERLTLFEIDRWDFDWQDDYHFSVPVRLPAGTRVDFEYTYDNSAANPNNPSSPPRPVAYGLESTDEMATLSMTLVADEREERPLLGWAMANRAVERSPGDPGAWVNLAVAVRACPAPQGGEFALMPHQTAAQHASRALELSPGRGDALRELGISLVELGDGARAEALFRRALKEDGEQIARLHLGQVLARSGRTPEAIVEFERAVLIFPNHARLRNNLATALFIEDRLEDAVGHYRVAVRLDPGYFNAWFNMGRALGSLGRTEEARAALERASALRPGAPEVDVALGELDGS